ncbi:hypothetical protein Tsubulata_005486 [Turnera subulata]|uniref:COBRA C-terminal domain-containing protein n=1 Tax=Turnera subulata TaxID=218843 RepID=A0A9Q0JCN5_9ROSI|nr:hypothetical protein Tsubulata_005486 [Turnera subulata]
MKARKAWHLMMPLILLIALPCFFLNPCNGQLDDDDYDDAEPAAPPPGLDHCNGVFLAYTFTSREKEYPKVKNATAQAWSFKSMVTITNTGKEDVIGWQVFVGFQHKEILVSAKGAVLMDADDFPADVSNGTTFAGSSMPDLKTSAETAGDYTQIAQQIEITGTQFGVRPPGIPMPKSLKLANHAYKCPKATKLGKTVLQVCCKKDPKAKPPKPAKKTKFMPRRYGDLSITYDVLQTYANNYMAQVTIDNNSPLGRLDHWNLTWEWKNGEFINTMRGAFTYSKDTSPCLYGKAGEYYADLDFSTVMNCEKSPIISDLPPTMKNDSKLGKLPYCCRNGSLLPSLMDEDKSRSIFQLQVFKLPPNTNRTAVDPPQKWKIDGTLNPQYRCGAPVRVAPTEFPDPAGLPSPTPAIMSWQIVCNITKPKERKARCCVSFSAFYNASVIPCNTCACGCDDNERCSKTAQAMLLPAEAALVPFENRTLKANAWARLRKAKIPNPRPCPDNCAVSINWHVTNDFRSGWAARITLFNWGDINFEDWFSALQFKKAYPGFEKVYSFNGTKLANMNKTIFFQGLPGLNYLMAESNGTRPGDPRNPGKQQSVISFTKKTTPGINVIGGDGFPSKVFFNGEECALPSHIPIKSAAASHKAEFTSAPALLIAVMTLLLMTDRLQY